MCSGIDLKVLSVNITTLNRNLETLMGLLEKLTEQQDPRPQGLGKSRLYYSATSDSITPRVPKIYLQMDEEDWGEVKRAIARTIERAAR